MSTELNIQLISLLFCDFQYFLSSMSCVQVTFHSVCLCQCIRFGFFIDLLMSLLMSFIIMVFLISTTCTKNFSNSQLFGAFCEQITAIIFERTEKLYHSTA